jgi:MazG family protein
MASDPAETAGRLTPPSADSPPTAGGEFSRLVEIMRLLRSPSGCPWDREQTLTSLAPFVLEEAHEVVDAIERGDLDALRGEIGDLVFEGVFLAQLCAEDGRFDVAASLRHVTDKLIRRHPHVFAAPRHESAPQVRSAGEVVEQWEAIKARERADAAASAAGALDGIPRALPSLLAAHEIGTRASAAGFDWDTATDVLAKIEEEVAELRRALTEESPERAADEMGDLLFALANLSRKLGIEPEAALRAANRKFTARFRAVEEAVERAGARMQDLPLAELERIWQQVKARS